MSENTETAQISSYHQAEDYFFAAVSQQTHYYGSCASAYLTGVEAASLNLLIIKQADADIDAVLHEGIRFFEHSGIPFTVLLPENVGPQLTGELNAKSLIAAYNTVAMQLAIKDFLPRSCSSDGFEIRCTNDRLNDWARPLESAFESNPTLIVQYRLRHQAAIEARKQLCHFSLYVKTQPVCSLTLSIKDGVARLDDIGTDVDFQGKGYATALIQHALKYAATSKAQQCFLEASSQGAAIYRKAGFTTLFNYSAFQRV